MTALPGALQDLNDLYFFAAVVENGGFSAAGRALGVPKSRLSKRIAQLEERLGVRLLQRTTRRFVVTEVGERFYGHCRAVLEEARAAQDAVDELRAEPRGVVRLSCPVSLTQTVLAHVLPDFMALYPKLQVRVTATNRRVDLIGEGYDLAIWYAAEPDPGLIVRRLGHYRMIICASPEYLARCGRPEHPSELIKHNCVIFYDAPTLGKGGREWQFTGPDGEFSMQMSGNLETNSAIAFRTAALLGQGIIIAPGPLVFDDLKSGALVPILSAFLPQQFSVDALYPHREHLPVKVRTFIDLLVDDFRQIDWDPCAHAGERSSGPVVQVVSSRDPPPARKRTSAVVKGSGIGRGR